MASRPKTTLSRYGGWLPTRIVHEQFLQHHVKLALNRLQTYRVNHPSVVLSAPLPGVGRPPQPGAPGPGDEPADPGAPGAGGEPADPDVPGLGDDEPDPDAPGPGDDAPDPDADDEEPPHVPSVQAFADAINGDPILRDLFDKIFLQVSPVNQVPDFDTLLFLLDGIVVQAPSYFIPTYPDGTVIGEPVGVPIYLIFDLLSNTSAAYDLFRLDGFNVALKNLLDSWGVYLASPNPPAPLPPSNSTLNATALGWFSPAGIEKLETDLGDLTFEQTYVCPQPEAENRGFATWDAFFTRVLQPGVRPVQGYNSSFIYSACESTVYRFSEQVKLHDRFWLKGQAYSLYDMLGVAGLEYANHLINGSVYQAFLSPLDYHRWHSPVKGTVLNAYTVPGTYYAVLPDEGAGPNDPDLEEGDPHGAIIRSQAWLTTAAARAVIFIQADDPIGLVAFIGVGMVEVSTCQLSVQQGDPVDVGTELGLFHFGGSTHALVFRPGIKVHLEPGVEVDQHVWVNSLLGHVEVQ